MKEKITARMMELAPLNMEKAEKIAAEFGVKARSIIASAVRSKIPYEKKARVNKAGKVPVSKSDLVEAIAEKFGVEVKALDGLDKANKTALEALLTSEAEVPAEEVEEPAE